MCYQHSTVGRQTESVVAGNNPVSMGCNPIPCSDNLPALRFAAHLNSEHCVESTAEEVAQISVRIPPRGIFVEHWLCAENGYPLGGKLF